MRHESSLSPFLVPSILQRRLHIPDQRVCVQGAGVFLTLCALTSLVESSSLRALFDMCLVP